MANTIKVSILGEVRDINSKLGQVNSSLGKVGKVAKFAGGLMAGAFAAGAVVQGVKSVVSAASDAQQSLGATETVFGKYSQSVISSSKNAAKQFGLDANTYRENANLIGALFANQGVSTKKLGGATKEIIGVGADLAATFGGTTTDAVNSLGSAFKGEFDSLEKYGISLKESTISAELAARGQDKLTGAALASAKQQVTTDLILKQSSKSRGAFAKETDTLAHQQQVLGAQFTNLKATLGTALLPVITKVLTVINTQFTPAIKAIGEFIAPVIARVKEFFSGLGGGTGPMTQVMAVFQTLGATIQNTIIPAVTAVATYLAGKLFPVFTQVVGIIQSRVIPIFAAIATFIIGRLVPALVAIYAKIATNLKPVFEQLVATVQAKVLPAINKFLGKLQEYGPTIAKVVIAVYKVVGAVLAFAAAVLGKVLPPVIRFAGFLTGVLFAAIGIAIGIIVKIAGAIVDFGSKVIAGAQKVGEFAGKVKDKIGDVVKYFTDLPGKITGAFGDAGTMLKQIGVNIVQGLGAGIESMYQWVRDKVDALSGWIPGWVKKKLGIASPSRVMKALGVFVSQGLGKGIEEGASAVYGAMEKVTDRIVAIMDKRFKKDKVAAAKAKEAIKSISDETKALATNADARKKNAESLAGARADLNALVDARNKELGLNKTLNEQLDEQASRLDNARSKLQSLKDEALSYAKAIKDNIVSFGAITGLVDGGAADVQASGLVDELTARVNQAQEFARMIQQLSAQGLNDTNLQQLIDAGAEAGFATANALVQGGPDAINQINALTAQLATTGQALGDTMSAKFHDAGINSAAALVGSLEAERANMYAAGIAVADGIVQGFQSTGDQLSAAGEKLAKKLVKAIKKALKINSPSRVFKDIGVYTTQGLVQGLNKTAAVERASYQLGKAVEGSYKQPQLSAPAYSGGSNGNNAPNVTIQLSGTVINPAKAGKEIADYLDAYYAVGGKPA